MEAKKKAILAIIIGLSVLMVALVGVLAWYGYDSTSYSRHIARAEKYLATGDYNKAVLEYQKAISIDPSKDDAYISLAEVYTSMGQTSLAEAILNNGIDRTGSNRITLALAEYTDKFINPGVNVEFGNDNQNVEMTLYGDGEGGINTTLLATIGATEYNDLRLKYTVSSSSTADGGCKVRIDSIGATLFYGKDSTDSSGSKPRSSAVPDYAMLDNVVALFNGKTDTTLADLNDYGAENVGLINENTISFVSGSCTVTAGINEKGEIYSGAQHSIVPIPDSEKSDVEGSCSATGRILSSTTGNDVADAELRFRVGDTTFGDILTTVRSDAFGNYSLKLNPGDYTVEVQCTGYTTEFFKVNVPFGDSVTLDNLYISPLLGDGQIRIVLEWGSSPRDLDSHLEGSTSGGSHIHTFYGQTKEVRSGNTIAELDLDDTDGYGPETTTIYDTNGVYNFYVVDFTATGTMSNSGATVKIYLPDGSAPIEVSICGGCGNEWNVCTIDHGQVTVNNRPK